MKTITTSALIAFVAITTAQVQAQTMNLSEKKEHHIEQKDARIALRKLEGSEVSEKAKGQFASDFSDASDVSWTRGKQFDEATFTTNGHQMTAYYDYDSNLVGTTATKDFTDLPENAQKEIHKHYKGYNIGAVIQYDDNEQNDTDMIYYGTQFDDVDHFFVTLSKAGKETILKVGMDGQVSFFKEIR